MDIGHRHIFRWRPEIVESPNQVLSDGFECEGSCELVFLVKKHFSDGTMQPTHMRLTLAILKMEASDNFISNRLKELAEEEDIPVSQSHSRAHSVASGVRLSSSVTEGKISRISVSWSFWISSKLEWYASNNLSQFLRRRSYISITSRLLRREKRQLGLSQSAGSNATLTPHQTTSFVPTALMALGPDLLETRKAAHQLVQVI